MNWEHRLPPLAQDALDILSAAAEDETKPDNEDGGGSRADFTKDEATATLLKDEDFTEGDAKHALKVLFQRGYIYYVDDDVYITPTDD